MIRRPPRSTRTDTLFPYTTPFRSPHLQIEARMAYWLMKSEPDAYGWDELVRVNGTEWNGVRNNAAAPNLRTSAVGDRASLYHRMTDLARVGGCEISPTASSEDVRVGTGSVQCVECVSGAC